MNKDQENSDSECDSQAPSEESSTEDIESSYKENSPHESGLSTESNNGEPTDDSSAAKKKSFVRKRWLFPLFLTITIGTGSYFYAQEKGIHLSITLPLDLNKSFPVTTTTLTPLAIQSETLPIKSGSEIVKTVGEPSLPEKPISENEKTINLLRSEIQPLKAELTQKSRIPSSQNAQHLVTHISGRILEREIEELIEDERPEPEINMQTSPTIPSPIKTLPTFKKSQNQQTAPHRSKEVQAYLDFIEDTGNKLVHLMKHWSKRLLTLSL